MPIISISGPSAAGKTTLINSLVHNYDAKLIPSYTTRAKRKFSVVENHYNYISRPEFLKYAKEKRFCVTEKVGENYYGTSLEDTAQASSSSHVWIMDVTAKTVLRFIEKGTLPEVCFILDISRKLSRERMIERGDLFSDIETRMKFYEEESFYCSRLENRHPNVKRIDGSQDFSIVEYQVYATLHLL